MNPNKFEQQGYTIVEELSTNYSAGCVTYIAEDLSDLKWVVIKQFQFARTDSTWDGYKAIAHEINILQQLNHLNIPCYLDNFELDGSYCLVQEYIDGQTLASAIAHKQLFTTDQIQLIVGKLLETLEYLQTAFSTPITHRDIKPDNIIIDERNQPHLIDFGGAKVSLGEGGSTVVGTLGFMAPEQRFGKVNTSTDLYSLGLTIICWLTYTDPNSMDDLIDIGTNRVIRSDRQLSHYDREFVRWLMKLVEPDPKLRFTDAKAALKAFERLDSPPPQSAVSSFAERPPCGIVQSRDFAIECETKTGLKSYVNSLIPAIIIPLLTVPLAIVVNGILHIGGNLAFAYTITNLAIGAIVFILFLGWKLKNFFYEKISFKGFIASMIIPSILMVAVNTLSLEGSIIPAISIIALFLLLQKISSLSISKIFCFSTLTGVAYSLTTIVSALKILPITSTLLQSFLLLETGLLAIVTMMQYLESKKVERRIRAK